ncbi:MAG: hypothetical protein Q9165_008773 [Trypethelium subeluteriae]
MPPVRMKNKKKASELSTAELRQKLQETATNLNKKSGSDEELGNNVKRLEELLRLPDDKFDANSARSELEALDIEIEMEDVSSPLQDQQSNGNDQSQDQGNGDDINPDEPIESKEKDESPLFVPKQAKDKNDQKSETGNSGSDKSYSDSEYGNALFQISALSFGEKVETLGWIGGVAKQYVNRYGPKNAARYRIDDFSDSAEYNDPMDKKISVQTNRLGDVLDESTGKFKYTKRHIRGLYGVAWKGMEDIDDAAEDLRLLDPKEIAEKKADGSIKKTPVVYVLVAWEKEGSKVYTWETRTALRVRWGTKAADKYIYQAACEQEERYIEYKTGKRQGLSRSPSVGLVNEHVSKEREKSYAAEREKHQRSSTPSPRSPRSVRSTPSVPDRAKSPRSNVSKERKIQKETMEEFKKRFEADYCEWLEAKNFSELPPEEKAEFVKAWKFAKANWEDEHA